MKTSAILLIAGTASLTAAEPLRQASEARLWLQVPKEQAPLKDIRVSTGSVNAAHWEKDPALRERFADITFPIRWWKWSGITIRFTPAESGTAQLTLSGPWGADANQTMYRQEILWDQCSATGTCSQTAVSRKPKTGNRLRGVPHGHRIPRRTLGRCKAHRPWKESWRARAGTTVP